MMPSKDEADTHADAANSYYRFNLLPLITHLFRATMQVLLPSLAMLIYELFLVPLRIRHTARLVVAKPVVFGLS